MDYELTTKNNSNSLEISFRNKRLSQNTIIAYTNAVKSFYDFIQKKNLTADFNSIRAWLNTIDNPRTYNLKLQAIKEFLLYHFRNEPPERQLELRDQIASLKHFNINNAVQRDRFITYEQVQKLADETSKNNNDVASCFVLGLFQTGCRVSELLGIKLKDCRGTNPVRISVIGKGRKHGEVMMSKDVFMFITETFKSQEYLFEKKNKDVKHKRYTRQHVTDLIKRESKKILGFEINISAHTLRHSKAMDMLERLNVPIQKIANALRHSKPSTTTDFYLHGSPTPEEQGIKVYKKSEN